MISQQHIFHQIFYQKLKKKVNKIVRTKVKERKMDQSLIFGEMSCKFIQQYAMYKCVYIFVGIINNGRLRVKDFVGRVRCTSIDKIYVFSSIYMTRHTRFYSIDLIDLN